MSNDDELMVMLRDGSLVPIEDAGIPAGYESGDDFQVEVFSLARALSSLETGERLREMSAEDFEELVAFFCNRASELGLASKITEERLRTARRRLLGDCN